MMRKPSTFTKLYSWHSAAMRAQHPLIHESEPQCGWFKVRLSKGGPMVAARVWVEREICPLTVELASEEVFKCEVNGQPRDAYREWVWLSKNPISKTEFEALTQICVDVPAMKATHAPVNLSISPMRP